MENFNTFTRHKLNKSLKAVSSIAMILCLGVPVAMAGATNRGDNTSAVPGGKSSTTTTPTDANARNDNIRKGTNKETYGRNTAGPSSGSGSSESKSISVGPTGESSRGNGTGTGDSSIK